MVDSLWVDAVIVLLPASTTQNMEPKLQINSKLEQVPL